MAYLNETGLAHFWEKIKSKIASSGNDTVNRIYPVGSVYVSTSSTSPASLFGGTWEQIQDRFLLAAGSNAAGSTGGEATHTLTTNEMPSHAHLDNEFVVRMYNAYTGPGVITGAINNGYNIFAPIINGQTPENPSYTSSVGGNGSHNNMPPYLTVYMWKRVS